MVTRVPADFKTLIWARERNNLTPELAAQLLGCELGELVEIERGDKLPTAGLFRKMADKYLLPEATLLGLIPSNERPLPKDFRSFDGNAVALSYETIIAVRRAQARQQNMERLAELDDSIIAPEIPIHALNEDAEKLGLIFRKEFGFSILAQLRLQTEKAFQRWRLMVEDSGVSVYIEPLGEDDSRGASIYFNAYPAIIIDQNEKHPGARNFTLFHEYCHLLLRQTGISNFNPRNQVEAFCNRFAAAFLMPREAIEAVVITPEGGAKIEPGVSDLDFAAKRLCVTISQLALRLEHLELAREGYFKRVTAKLKPPTAKPKRKGGDWRFAYVSRYGYRLPDSVIGSLDRKTIGPVDAARMLDADPANLPEVKRTIKERRDEVSVD
jgi:Zn-dependent peptidase ImmA (M78 family)